MKRKNVIAKRTNLSTKMIVIQEVKKALKKQQLLEKIKKRKKLKPNIKRKLIKNLIMEGKEDKKKMQEFVKFLGDSDITINDIEHEYDNVYSHDGEEYLILTDKEADQAMTDVIERDINELGFEQLGHFGQIIIDNYISGDWFDEYMKTNSEEYIDEIESETDERFGNRLIAELYDIDILEDGDFEEDGDGEPIYDKLNGNVDMDDKKEEYVEYRANEYDDDGVFYCQETYDDDTFKKMAIRHGDIDYKGAGKQAARMNGRGNHLSSYDGEEHESGKYYFYQQ